MDGTLSLQAYEGRWAIRSATRPAVWPFLCATEVELLPAGGSRVFVRVRTAGGAILRGYTLDWRPAEAGITLASLEANGRSYHLALELPRGEQGHRTLAGTWVRVGSDGEPILAEGCWMAERSAQAVESVAA